MMDQLALLKMKSRTMLGGMLCSYGVGSTTVHRVVPPRAQMRLPEMLGEADEKVAQLRGEQERIDGGCDGQHDVRGDAAVGQRVKTRASKDPTQVGAHPKWCGGLLLGPCPMGYCTAWAIRQRLVPSGKC